MNLGLDGLPLARNSSTNNMSPHRLAEGSHADGCRALHADKVAWSRRKALIVGVGTLAAAGLTPAASWANVADVEASGASLAPLERATPRAYAFFTAAEAAFIDAALQRLIPADELGAGAVEAGVTRFIDRQLAGPFGQAVDWYMAGPWSDGTQQQGFQSKHAPAQIYRIAIAAIDARVSGAHGFAGLDVARRDAWLQDLHDDKPKLGEVSAKTFFDLLWHNTQEGFFADPLYGGNQGFAGWQLIGFTGPRYNHLATIGRFGVRDRRPVVGLMGRDPARQPQQLP